jgi:hypothetical protein
MDNYDKVKLCFSKNNCTLITTFEEFEELRKDVLKQSYHFVRVRFIGICLHESSVVFTNFNIRKTGMNCKACTKKNSIELRKHINNTNEIESDGILIIEEYLTPQYEIIRTKEGCLADLAIRKKSEDKWIPVQVKTTIQKSHGMYSFGFNHNHYKNMLLICVCISEKKIWIIPYNQISITSRLNISIKSKYNKYIVDSNTVFDTIDGYRSEIVCLYLDTILIPITSLQQREQLYVRKREQRVPFLEYKYPLIQNTCVDVIINGKNVQEKVLGYDDTKKVLRCRFASHNGKKDGKICNRCYRLGENEYYWLHSSIDNRFWIIPEHILYDKGYLSKQDETLLTKTLCFKSENNITKEWLDVYEYNYDTLNNDIILKIFE